MVTLRQKSQMEAKTSSRTVVIRYLLTIFVPAQKYPGVSSMDFPDPFSPWSQND